MRLLPLTPLNINNRNFCNIEDFNIDRFYDSNHVNKAAEAKHGELDKTFLAHIAYNFEWPT